MISRIRDAEIGCTRAVNGHPRGHHLVILTEHEYRIHMDNKTCSVEGCEEKHRARGFCMHHYKRWKRHGDPRLGRDNVDWKLHHHDVRPDGCWDHRGPYTPKGYGRAGRFGPAHRYYWTMLRGPIPDGLTIDHLCLNKKCVNPEHLEVVTAAENTRRMLHQRRLRTDA